MSIHHTSPNIMYIELSGVGAILSHLINQSLRQNIITDEVAHNMVVFIFKYELNVRSLWLGLAREKMGIIDLEKMVIPLNIPDSVKEFIIFNCNDIFDKVLVNINELLNLITKEETWDILAIKECGLFAIQIRNEGDYRVYEWSRLQQSNNTNFAKLYSIGTLEM